MKKYLTIILGIVCLISSNSQTLNATTPIENKLGSFFEELKGLQKQGLLDGQVMIAKGDRVLLDVQSKEIKDKEPQFMIGSISKQFYAVALLRSLYDTSLANTEESKVADVKQKLNQPISRFLPEEASVWNGKMPSWAHTITLHQLLTHTSGIFNYSDSDGFEYNDQLDPEMKFFEFPHAPADIIHLVSDIPLEFAPGSHFSYSNTGYMLIAEVIESITSMPSADYLEQTLFQPLDLTSTISPTIGRLHELQKDPSCKRLVREGRFDPIHNPERVYTPLHHEDISVAKGAASIMSTASDLLKWNQALHKNKTVLPNALYELLVKENLDGYAYGLGVQRGGSGVKFTHSGVIGAYKSFLMYVPGDDLTIVVLSNISYDWHKSNNEVAALASTMQGRIPNEEARFNMASQMLMERHPITRGHEFIMESVHEIFD